MQVVRTILICLFFLFTGSLFGQAADKPNVLFIIVDDLNDYVEGLTDMPQVHTPNFSALMEEGTVFTNAFVNAPGCAPSRTSFFSGKDLYYTGVYVNEQYQPVFRDNFTEEKGNSEVYTLPEILKDSGGYFTYSINKTFHTPAENDYDEITGDPCSKTMSWNRKSLIIDSEAQLDAWAAYGFGNTFDWGLIPDDQETLMEDYIGADSAISFMQQYAAGEAETCDRPFFMALGFSKPHLERYIPEKYSPGYYAPDIYQDPFPINYNVPENGYPYNGIVMPPQPDILYGDYLAFPPDGYAAELSDAGKTYDKFENWVNALDPLPTINKVLDDNARRDLVMRTLVANYQITYMAAVQFIDAQLGRVLDALDAVPELKENTVIVLISDNGYSLGEKKHWTKWTMWETDIRVPMVIVHPDLPGNRWIAQPVQLLDLFPTICDITNTDYPIFQNGSRYLDGNSIWPLLQDTSLHYELPVIAAYERNNGPASCFPQYSVRNDRFHYIRYRYNNGTDIYEVDCDPATPQFEEEIYELGIDRSVDPYEWNNLIANNDFAPVRSFLQQWLPDSIMYGNRGLKAVISTASTPCLVAQTDTIHCSFSLRDTVGHLISMPDGYRCKWYTNYNDEIVFDDTTLVAYMHDVPADMYASGQPIYIYLEIINNANNAIVGFDMREIYADPNNTPTTSFSVEVYDSLQVRIEDVDDEGEFLSSVWEMGDGTVFYGDPPATYAYAEAGIYTITHTLNYGNADCSISDSVIVDLSVIVANNDALLVYPNPAGTQLTISLDAPVTIARIEFFSLAGSRVVEDFYLVNDDFMKVTLPVDQLKPGMYLVSCTTSTASYVVPVVIAR